MHVLAVYTKMISIRAMWMQDEWGESVRRYFCFRVTDGVCDLVRVTVAVLVGVFVAVPDFVAVFEAVGVFVAVMLDERVFVGVTVGVPARLADAVFVAERVTVAACDCGARVTVGVTAGVELRVSETVGVGSEVALGLELLVLVRETVPALDRVAEEVGFCDRVPLEVGTAETEGLLLGDDEALSVSEEDGVPDVVVDSVAEALRVPDRDTPELPVPERVLERVLVGV